MVSQVRETQFSDDWHQAGVPSTKFMNRLLTAATGLVLSLSGISALQAAPALPLAQPKAANLARMRAESLNGGLGSYRAAACMYETGATSCLISRSDEGISVRVPRRATGMGTGDSTRSHPGNGGSCLPGWGSNSCRSLQRTDPLILSVNRPQRIG